VDRFEDVARMRLVGVRDRFHERLLERNAEDREERRSFHGLFSPSPNRSIFSSRNALPSSMAINQAARNEIEIDRDSIAGQTVLTVPCRVARNQGRCPDGPAVAGSERLFLAMTDLAAHPALLATDLATTLSATTTCHTFSSGCLNEHKIQADR
jgi:hypothetical protein